MRFWVTWRKADKYWAIKRTGAGVLGLYKNKEQAISIAAGTARTWAKTGGNAELFIHNKDGSIGKGSHGRRTYGKDPRKSRG